MKFSYEPGRLFHETDGQVDAEILFPTINAGKTWSIDHTYVAPTLRGQGIANQMLAQVVQLAREADVTLRPTCKFAQMAFARHPDYQLLADKG